MSEASPEVCETPDDPALEEGGPTWPEATDPELFAHYAEPDGGGGAEGGSAVGNDENNEVAEVPPEEVTDEPAAEPPTEAAAEKPAEAPKKKSPSEMTPEERQADKTAKLDEYAQQSQEEKEARWAKNDGRLSQEAWDKLQDPELSPGARKQAMLQAGIDNLDYDDPRREQLEQIKHWMNGEDSVTPQSKGPAGKPGNLLVVAGRTGKEGEAELEERQTRCGEVAGQMLSFTKDAKAPGFPKGSYYNATGVEGDKNATPGSGDIFHLRNEAKNGKPGDDNGHASMFVVSSPDGKQWLTYDGGQGDANGPGQRISLSTRHVSVDENGRTMVSEADRPSTNPADNGARAVSRTWDYQKMHDKYLSSPEPTQSKK